MIREAIVSDIPEIMTILQENLLSNLSHLDQNSLESRGFIIFGFNEYDLKKMIEDKKNFMVLIAQECQQIIGYTICFDDKDSPQKLLYYKHIAILPNKKGVAKQLMQAIIDKAYKSYYQGIICHIALYPIKNCVSIAFHEKYGFKLLSTIQKEEIQFGLYKLDLDGKALEE
jgi:L-amino acid N-acyltransferase YncA